LIREKELMATRKLLEPLAKKEEVDIQRDELRELIFTKMRAFAIKTE
jgi:hypothetical protein